MEITPYFEFQGNIFYKKSIIECLIEAKNMKAVSYFAHEIIKNGYKMTVNSLI
jgi:predicted peroxiredoxin